MNEDKKQSVITMLEQGMSLRQAAAEIGVHAATVLKWTHIDEFFAQQYARAREVGYKLLAEEILEISDGDGDWQRDRLRVDSRKFILARMLPKIYGDKVTQEHTGPEGGPIQVISGVPRADN